MSDSPPWKVFMPAMLDDLGLSQSVLRVYIHIARVGRCWEAVPTIAQVCRMNKDTVKDALRELLDRGMIGRTKRAGETSVYELLPPPWKLQPGGKEGPAPKTSQPEAGQPPVETRGQPPVETRGQPPVETRGHEGYPMKVIQEGNPVKGGALALTAAHSRGSSLEKEIQFPWDSQEELPDLFWRLKRYQLQASFDYLFRAFHEIRARKLRFRDRHFIRAWQAVLETELDAFAKNRKTQPRPEEIASTADGTFLGEVELDRFGDLAALKAAGIYVKPNTDELRKTKTRVPDNLKNLPPGTKISL